MLLRLMAGPPRVSASELRDTIRVLFLDQGLQKDSADENHHLRRALDEYLPVKEFCAHPRIEVFTLVESIKAAGQRVDGVIKLMGLLQSLPPPALESVEQMAMFLKGPPRVNVYERR